MSRQRMFETKKVTLSKIDTTNMLYQNRDPRASTYGDRHNNEMNSKQHINKMVQYLQSTNRPNLPNIEVTQDPNDCTQYLIVDGFHRAEAYKIVNKKSKTNRFKQITVNVHKQMPTVDYLLNINSTNTKLPLSYKQQTEMNWQKFLRFGIEQPELTIKEIAASLGIGKSTVSSWRNQTLKWTDKGYFDKGSDVDKNEHTGYPLRAACLQKDREEEYYNYEGETQGALLEPDKKYVKDALEMYHKLKEPDKALEHILANWGVPLNTVDYDADLSDQKF